MQKRFTHIKDDISTKISELDSLRMQREEKLKKYREIDFNKQQNNQRTRRNKHKKKKQIIKSSNMKTQY